MFSWIDKKLNEVPMYRLMLYILASISLAGVVLMPSRFFSLLCLTWVCYGANLLFAKVFRVAASTESSAITAFILFLILFPASTLAEYGILALVAVIAMASKYIITLRNRHIFNPAAVGAVAASFLGSGAGWWVGSAALFPVVALGAFLIVRKTRRGALFLVFALAAFVSLFLSAQLAGLETSTLTLVKEGFLSWPIIFFGAFMLTEPLTLPAARKWQLLEATFIGLLFAIPFHAGPFYASPELLLLLGNALVLFAGVKRGYRLRFIAKEEVSPGVFNLSFAADQPLVFTPGQYMEVTLDHAKPDARGNRRTFTVASSPGGNEAQFGIRVPEIASSFKKALMQLTPGSLLFGSNLAGEFILPKDSGEKLVFIAGGVGITPFKSMVEDLLARNERRDAVLLYCCKTEHDFAYRSLFEQAASVGVRAVFIATDRDGFLTKEKITELISDVGERVCYLSGPNVMVQSYAALLRECGVASRNVRTDYFPGY